MVARQDRAGLGQPVPFQDENACRMEELRDLGRQRSPARHAEAKPAAQSGPQLAEYQPIGEGLLDPEGRRNRSPFPAEPAGPTADLQCPVEDPLADRWRRLHPRQDLRVHLLEHSGHAAEEVRCHLPQVLRKPLDALGERGGQSQADPEEALHTGERMGEREKEEMDVSLAHPRGLRDHVERRQVIAVRLHDALGGTGRAGGVHDRRDVGRLQGRQAMLDRSAEAPLATQHAKPLPVEHAQSAGLRSRGRSLDHDHRLQARHLRGHGQDLPELLLILDEQRPGLGVAHDVAERLGWVGRIHRDGDAADREDREVGPDPLRPTLGENPDRFARLTSERD